MQTRRSYKNIKPSRGNILVVDIGMRVDDGVGMTDYRRYYRVKRGKIQKRIIKRMKRGEDFNMFNTVELKPVTNLAYVLVIEKPSSNPPSMPTKVWKVILFKKRVGKVPRIIRI